MAEDNASNDFVDLTDQSMNDVVDLLSEDDTYETFKDEIIQPIAPKITFKPLKHHKINDDGIWVSNDDDDIWIDSYSNSDSGSMDSSGSDFNDDLVCK